MGADAASLDRSQSKRHFAHRKTHTKVASTQDESGPGAQACERGGHSSAARCTHLSGVSKGGLFYPRLPYSAPAHLPTGDASQGRRRPPSSAPLTLLAVTGLAPAARRVRRASKRPKTAAR